MVPKGCPETSVKNYRYSLLNNLEERSSHLLRGGSLKSLTGILDRQIWLAVSGSSSPNHLGLKLLALCAPPLVPSVISRGAPRQKTRETSVSEGRNWARNGRSIL